jgi:hypothetical protein
MRTRIEFNSQGNKLAELMESPSGEVRAYVLFAVKTLQPHREYQGL